MYLWESFSYFCKKIANKKSLQIIDLERNKQYQMSYSNKYFYNTNNSIVKFKRKLLKKFFVKNFFLLNCFCNK